MPEYYLDIETLTAAERPNPSTDKIITIQYQQLSSFDGRPIGDLRILTEWDCGSEKAMLDAFKPVFLTTRPFDFIPVGLNLTGFDLIALTNKFDFYYGLCMGMSLLRERPSIDLKSTLVMMNNGRFSGYSGILGKSESGSMVKGWYLAKDYAKITNYIKEEASLFITLYQALRKQLPHLALRNPSQPTSPAESRNA